MIGVVMQDDSLFAGSIADNIAFFAADPDRGAHRGLRPGGGGARRHRRHADGLRHADRRHGHGAVGRAEAARAARPRALPRARGCCCSTRRRAISTSRARRRSTRRSRAMALTRIVVAHRPETIHASGRVITLDDGRIASDRSAGGRRGGMSIRLKIIALPGGRGDHAAEQRGGDLHLDRAHRLLLRPDPAGAPADGHGHPAVGAHEPLLGEHRRAAAARKDRA